MADEARRGPRVAGARGRLFLATLGLPAAVALLAADPGPGPGLAPAGLAVDVNSAPPEVLDALPNLGPALVGRIVAARGDQPFRSLDDLDRRVRGIGPATVAGLRPYLRFEAAGASPGPR